MLIKTPLSSKLRIRFKWALRLLQFVVEDRIKREGLAREIDVIVKQRRYGYTSVSEFVKDAIRWYLKEVSKSPFER